MGKFRCNIFALLREFKHNIDMKTFVGQLICSAADNCHGKRNNITAKVKDSLEKEKTHGKKNNLTAKRHNLTANRKTSQQIEKPHDKKK